MSKTFAIGGALQFDVLRRNARRLLMLACVGAAMLICTIAIQMPELGIVGLIGGVLLLVGGISFVGAVRKAFANKPMQVALDDEAITFDDKRIVMQRFTRLQKNRRGMRIIAGDAFFNVPTGAEGFDEIERVLREYNVPVKTSSLPAWFDAAVGWAFYAGITALLFAFGGPLCLALMLAALAPAYAFDALVLKRRL